MNYEIENALRRKVDEWQYRALEQTVDAQKYDIQNLNRQVGELQAKLSNYYNLISNLIDRLNHNLEYNTENPEDYHDLKQYL